ncbi:MAG: transglycosylase SLT domain-containing protein [Elusimicrobia bacterium]|nr:transglycosylase SLT domain-containing protein [Elusimicrobiota bacterium]
MKRWTLALALLGLFSAGCDLKKDGESPPPQPPSPAAAADARGRARSMGAAADSLVSYAEGARAAAPGRGDPGRNFFDGEASAYADPGGAVYAGGARSYGPRPPLRYTSMTSYMPKDLEVAGPPPAVMSDPSQMSRLRRFVAGWGADMRVADEMISQAVRKGMNPLLVLATGMQESGLRNGRVSSAGALGPMQLMPDTACGLGACNRQAVRTNVGLNVNLGTNYMMQMWDQFVGSSMLSVNPLNPAQAPRVAAALAAYNAGPGRVMQSGGRVPQIAETQDYVRKIFGYYGQLSRAIAN